MSKRDEIRKALLGAPKNFRREKFTIGETEIEIRQPTVRERDKILAAVGGAPRADNGGKLLVEAALLCAVVPGTDERIFEEGDRESLEGMPVHGSVDDIGNRIIEMLNVKPEALGKDSGAPASASSSSI